MPNGLWECRDADEAGAWVPSLAFEMFPEQAAARYGEFLDKKQKKIVVRRIEVRAGPGQLARVYVVNQRDPVYVARAE